jgi:hypothetical protein
LWGKALAPLVFLACLFGLTALLWLPCVNWFELSSGVSLPIALAGTALLFATTFSFTTFGLWFSWRCRTAAAATGWTLGTLFIGVLVLHNLARWLIEILVLLLGWLYAFCYSILLGVPIDNPTLRLRYDYQSYYDGYGTDPTFTTVAFDILRLMSPLREMSHLFTVTDSSRPYFSSEPYSMMGQPGHTFLAAGIQVMIGCLVLLDVRRRMKRSRFLDDELNRRQEQKPNKAA